MYNLFISKHLIVYTLYFLCLRRRSAGYHYVCKIKVLAYCFVIYFVGIYIYMYISGVVMKVYDSLYISSIVSRRPAVRNIISIIEEKWLKNNILFRRAHMIHIQYSVIVLLVITYYCVVYNVCDHRRANRIEHYEACRHRLGFVSEIIVTIQIIWSHYETLFFFSIVYRNHFLRFCFLKDNIQF